MIWHAKITEETAKKLCKCKIVERFAIGYDQVNYEALKNTILNLPTPFLV
ncbi:hypothetical protein [Bartonella tribocorum]